MALVICASSGKHSVPALLGIQEELASCCTMGAKADRRLAEKRDASSSADEENTPSSADEENTPACKRMCSKEYMAAAAAAESVPAPDSSQPQLLQDLQRWRCPEANSQQSL